MNKFSAKFSEQIEGAISAFDGLVFRSTPRKMLLQGFFYGCDYVR